MKKLSLTLLMLICAVSMVFGLTIVASSNTVSADAEVTLSQTAIKKSTSKDKLLLVTAIKNLDDVYEMGYTGLDGVEKYVCENNTYYIHIAGVTKSWAAEDIFGPSFEGAGMIIWEIAYYPGNSYEVQAYAKYGRRNDAGNLVKYSPEAVVEASERIVSIEEYEIEFLNWDGSELETDTWAYGETPTFSGSAPTKAATETEAYRFIGWDNEPSSVTGNATYTAQFETIDISDFSVSVSGSQKLYHTYDVEFSNVPDGATATVTSDDEDNIYCSNGTVRPMTTDGGTVSVTLSKGGIDFYQVDREITVSAVTTSPSRTTIIDVSNSNAIDAVEDLGVNLNTLTALYDVTDGSFSELTYSAGVISDTLTVGEKKYAALTADETYLVDVVVADYVINSLATMHAWGHVNNNFANYQYVVVSQDLVSDGSSNYMFGITQSTGKHVPDGFTFNGLGCTISNVWINFGIFGDTSFADVTLKNLTLDGVYLNYYALFGVMGTDTLTVENVDVYNYTMRDGNFTNSWGALLGSGINYFNATTYPHLIMRNCYVEYTGAQTTLMSLTSNNCELTLDNTQIVSAKGQLAYNNGERGSVRATYSSRDQYGVTDGMIILTDESYITDSRAVRFKSGVKDNPTITFKNEDGTTLSSVHVSYGTIPSYIGTPTQTQSDTTAYTFAGWDKSFTAAKENAVYTANYDEVNMSALSIAVETNQKLLHEYDVAVSGVPTGWTYTLSTEGSTIAYAAGQIQANAIGSGNLITSVKKNGVTVYVVETEITVSAVTTDYSRTTIINVANSNAINEVSADHVVPWASVTALYDVTDGIANKSAVAFSNGAITADLSSTFGEKKYIALTADNTYLVDVVLADYIIDSLEKLNAWGNDANRIYKDYHYVVISQNLRGPDRATELFAGSSGTYSEEYRFGIEAPEETPPTVPDGFTLNGLGCTISHIFTNYGIFGQPYFSNATVKNLTLDGVYLSNYSLFGVMGVGVLNVENVNVYNYIVRNANAFSGNWGAMIGSGVRYSDASNYPRVNMKNCYIEYTGTITTMWSLCSNNCKLTLDNTTIKAENGTLAKYIGEKGSVTAKESPRNTGVTTTMLILNNGSSITDSRGPVTSITAKP